jgi:hypothetical protein
MLDTTQAVVEYINAVYEKYSQGYGYVNFAGEYGEPGYHVGNSLGGNKTPLIVLANHWCRCDESKQQLHVIAFHFPKTFAALEDQGVEFEWYDEWVVDYENDKAYRSKADSYSWQPSYVDTDDGILTPDDDFELWVEWAVENERALPSHIWSASDIKKAGFIKFNSEPYESGWHPGQDADSNVVKREIHEAYGDNVEILFYWVEQSQFYARFDAYYRIPEDDES